MSPPEIHLTSTMRAPYRDVDDFNVLGDVIDIENYVQSQEFDYHCSQRAVQPLSYFSSDSASSDSDDIGYSHPTTGSSATTIEATCGLSTYESANYYSGVTSSGHGPNLIYRTSNDEFSQPTGPEAYTRQMRVVPVPDEHEISNVWELVLDNAVETLTKRNIRISDIELVRFTWLDETESPEEFELDIGHNFDNEDINYDDIPPIEPIEYGVRHYTNPTVWIAVCPGHVTGEASHEAAQEIESFLESLGLSNIDIAFRESVVKELSGHGPALYRADEDGGPLKEVIDNLSVALSLPIAGRNTDKQGTLGPYFAVGNKLCAITTRHTLFSPDDNSLYRYSGSEPKNEVLLMSQPTFAGYVSRVQAVIGRLQGSIKSLEMRVSSLEIKVKAGIDVASSQTRLKENEVALARAKRDIEDLKRFFVEVVKGWGKPNDRAIGHVIWAPPIGVGVPPHRYTRDLCVVELYKDRFKHMVGNVLSLGPELDGMSLKEFSYARADVPYILKHVEDGLLSLDGILATDQIINPNPDRQQVRRVLKRGFATNTTVGTLTRFRAFVRKYKDGGTVDSLEIPILSHEGDLGTFSKRGDSGSIIVTPTGELVGLLTSGTCSGPKGSDITFATPFEWVWELIKEEFPTANLTIDVPSFLADVGA